MYEICKNVIESGRYELSAMLRKIDTLWLQNDLTDSQKTELVELARKHADPAASLNLLAMIQDLDARVRALEGGGSDTEHPTEQETDPDYPLYIQGKAYRNGDKVTFKGKKYRCQLPDYVDVCTFSPESYPAYWILEEVKK